MQKVSLPGDDIFRKHHAQDRVIIRRAQFKFSATRAGGDFRASQTLRTDKSLLLSYCAEYEVSILFGYIFQLSLSTVQESFPCQTTGTDSYLRLVDIVSGTSQIFFHA